jgi:multicomponent Na+:H+ antiporter subunit A
MASMIGLVAAGELYSLMVFWDLTAIVSFLLIGTDRTSAEARRAALMALVITGGSAVLLFVAVVLLHVHAGTTSIRALPGSTVPPVVLSVTAVLVIVAAAAKSAQAPLHFWLPRAMVAAGVFLLSRLHSFLSLSPMASPLLLALGAISIATGSVLALGAEDVKRVLAYSTVAQYGYITLLLGYGGEKAAGAAAFYVLAHAVAKSAPVPHGRHGHEGGWRRAHAARDGRARPADAGARRRECSGGGRIVWAAAHCRVLQG